MVAKLAVKVMVAASTTVNMHVALAVLNLIPRDVT
jgi:hypothetical protein